MSDFTPAEAFGACLGAIITLVLIVVLSVAIIYWLWNWIMPDVCGMHQITFAQACGIWLLSSALFKSFSPASFTMPKK